MSLLVAVAVCQRVLMSLDVLVSDHTLYKVASGLQQDYVSRYPLPMSLDVLVSDQSLYKAASGLHQQEK